MSAVYGEEKDQLLQLEDRFNKLETEYLNIMEEKRIEKEKREDEERLLLVHFFFFIRTMFIRTLRLRFQKN